MRPARKPTTTLPPPYFLQNGRPLVDATDFVRLTEILDLSDQPRPVVINLQRRKDLQWPLPEVRQAVIVPLIESDRLFGWLGAFNHCADGEFGSTEANLLSSVAAILGIHAGNIELYRQQGEFLAGVVRALTSAIDAKDPYTCGHSDRVARVAVQLAKRLGCSAHDLETIYLSGLLHDIGKIGIDDQVLRKPGKLTEAEYEHIKLHAEIGYRILKDIKQLDDVLPVVRHHHEAWNGKGYPFGLSGEEIPFFARIVSVADAFDAMSSDRPYRKGIPDEQLDAILARRGGQAMGCPGGRNFLLHPRRNPADHADGAGATIDQTGPRRGRSRRHESAGPNRTGATILSHLQAGCCRAANSAAQFGD